MSEFPEPVLCSVTCFRVLPLTEVSAPEGESYDEVRLVGPTQLYTGRQDVVTAVFKRPHPFTPGGVYLLEFRTARAE